jgi:DNA modification methylase
MKIERIAISKLTPDPNNARTHDQRNLDAIAGSLSEFGQRKPIVITQDNIIAAGNGTVEAAKSLGWTDIEVVRVPADWDADRIKAFALADNRSAELAQWDEQVMASQLLELQQVGFDIQAIGFELTEPPVDPESIEEDEIPEDAPTRTSLGDIWQLGRHRLMCADATDNRNATKLLDGQKADLAFTDPPYGINVVSKDGKVGADFGIAKKGKYSQVIADDTTDTARSSYEVLKANSYKQIIWGGNYFTNFLPFSDGWIIWDKRGDSGIRNTFADGEMAWCSFHTPVRIYTQLWNGMIREGEKDKRIHPTQKPIKTIGKILEDFSQQNHLVMDLFGGSGSTLIAAEKTNRTCYMMELDPKYCDVIIQRWENLTGEKAELVNAGR